MDFLNNYECVRKTIEMIFGLNMKVTLVTLVNNYVTDFTKYIFMGTYENSMNIFRDCFSSFPNGGKYVNTSRQSFDLVLLIHQRAFASNFRFLSSFLHFVRIHRMYSIHWQGFLKSSVKKMQHKLIFWDSLYSSYICKKSKKKKQKWKELQR